MQYAGFWRRFIAAIIDIFIIMLLSFFSVFFLGFFVGGVLNASEIISGIGNGIALFNVVLLWLYFALQESSVKQATLGKRLMNIYVSTATQTPLTFSQASIRHFSKYISSFFFIGFIMAAFTQKKQALHDLMADALVLKY